MKFRIKWIYSALLVGLLALVGGSGCQPANKEQMMSPDPQTTPPAPAVPPIDRIDPGEIATATFSMG